MSMVNGHSKGIESLTRSLSHSICDVQLKLLKCLKIHPLDKKFKLNSGQIRGRIEKFGESGVSDPAGAG